MHDYPHNNPEQQMHNILDESINAMRRSFDKSSTGNRSNASSRQSPAIRKKSQLRKMLDDMKSNHSSIGTYSEDLGYSYNKYNDEISSHHQLTKEKQLYPKFEDDSSTKRTRIEKYNEMHNELALLQQKIEGLNEKLNYNSTESSKFLFLCNTFYSC